jgi:hypothetical protein
MPAYNERFGAMAALPRRQFCAKLHVITPQQVQWKPPLRQAAGTLAAMARQDSAKSKKRKKEGLKVPTMKAKLSTFLLKIPLLMVEVPLLMVKMSSLIAKVPMFLFKLLMWVLELPTTAFKVPTMALSVFPFTEKIDYSEHFVKLFQKKLYLCNSE